MIKLWSRIPKGNGESPFLDIFNTKPEEVKKMFGLHTSLNWQEINFSF